MRARKKANSITANAIAGTHVVLLGLDIDASKRAGFLGFAIQRTEAKTGNVFWMKGMKTFEATTPNTSPGQSFSSQEHPFQSFQWSDYTVTPGNAYKYKIVPLYGKPANLDQRNGVEISITTEEEWAKPHSVFFNRGSVASQAYAQQFQNQPPSVAGQAAYDWLSRGLHEALLAFIARAKNSTWQIHGAVYEFQDIPVLTALKDASDAGATVSVIYDAIPGTSGPKAGNEKAISDVGIEDICIPRTLGTIMHNKFFVLSKDGVPKMVWTGSTNLTENGIYGHSNLGHAVEDSKVAKAYFEYWQRLSLDPPTTHNPAYKAGNETQTPTPPADWPKSLLSVYSPRPNLNALQWYADLAATAQSGLFATFPFGMHKLFQQVYAKDDDILRFGLMDKRTAQTREPNRTNDLAAIHAIAARKNVVLAVGNNIVTNEFDRWLAELDQIVSHVFVHWVHTKYMIVDPLSENPIIVSGSANFSDASTKDNDENVLVIRGDKRVADIYLGEFMRLHSHYAFREAVAIHVEQGGNPTDWKPQFLQDSDAWQVPYFDAGDSSGKFARREFFSQAM